MEYASPLVEGRLLRRYKRFLADVELADGRRLTAHTPNTGSMCGCAEPGSRVWLRDTGSSTRKYPFSWELVEARPGVLVGINTLLSNGLVREAIENGVVRELTGYPDIRAEVRYGQENSRIDLLLEGGDASCYVEVKNVTLVDDGVAMFPDAVSVRGTKHLRELAGVVCNGGRGVIFYCVQREDVRELRPADAIDPAYGEQLRVSLDAGVEALAYVARVTTEGVELRHSLPIHCP